MRDRGRVRNGRMDRRRKEKGEAMEEYILRKKGREMKKYKKKERGEDGGK